MAVKKQLMKKTSAPKVNKNAKPGAIEPRIESDEEYRCVTCGHKYKKQEVILERPNLRYFQATMDMSLIAGIVSQNSTRATSLFMIMMRMQRWNGYARLPICILTQIFGLCPGRSVPARMGKVGIG